VLGDVDLRLAVDLAAEAVLGVVGREDDARAALRSDFVTSSASLPMDETMPIR
jgi:hypothetical protein